MPEKETVLEGNPQRLDKRRGCPLDYVVCRKRTRPRLLQARAFYVAPANAETLFDTEN
jgi:hypothetical protein